VGRTSSLVAFVWLGLVACSTPLSSEIVPPQVERVRPQIQLELPQSLEHWRAALESDLLLLESLYAEQSTRWPFVPNDDALRLVVLADIPRAQNFLSQLGLKDDPKVARTYPNRRLALVPMPRDDRILRQRPAPLATWRSTFCHEAAHLLSLDRPSLRVAPLWFQEGYAESWSETFVEIAPSTDAPQSNRFGLLTAWAAAWRIKVHSQSVLLWLQNQPAEVRLSAWVYLVHDALQRDDSAQPWLSVSETMPFLENAQTVRLFGRDASAQSVHGSEAGCLASLPHEMVALNLSESWSCEQPLQIQLRLGRSGNPEAGLLLMSGEHQLRLRFNVFGQWLAMVERPGELRHDRMAFADNSDGIGLRHTFLFTQRDGVLRVTCDGQNEQSLDLPTELSPPFEIQVFVRDGALEFSATTIEFDS